MEGLPKKFELGPENILTKKEIFVVIGEYLEDGLDIENAIVFDEVNDEMGLALLEVKFETGEPDEYIQYEYQRKGIHGKNRETVTTLESVWYKNGLPFHGEQIGKYDEEKGEWLHFNVDERM